MVNIHRLILHVPFAVYFLLLWSSGCLAQQSDPTQFNGGSILAMAGRNSVAIAIDARFGLGFQTISTANLDGGSFAGDTNSRIILLPDSNTLMAWTGLYGDGISFTEEMNILLGRKVRRSNCMGFETTNLSKEKMSPRAIAMFMSHLLYRRRSAPYYVEPVIVGLESVSVPCYSPGDTSIDVDGSLKIDGVQQLQAIAASQYTQEIVPSKTEPINKIPQSRRYRKTMKPYLCTTDMLGARSTSSTFVCSGVASRSLHGTAEALWRPNLEADELVEVCGKAFMSALERDCFSGYGAAVYLIQSHQVENGDSSDNNISIKEFVLACRND